MAARALRSGPERSRDEQFVGRLRELAVLHAQLGRVCEGRSSLVVLHGPAGIGKTALAGEFLSVIENAVVLECSGDEGESELPYGMLGQLGAQAQHAPEALAGLARPATGVTPDPLVVGAALLELLAQLQLGAPVVIAIDGADWADLPSLQAMTFALRRLRTDRVLAIVIVRESDHPRLPDGLRRLLRSSAALRLPLGGLSARELQALSARLGPVRLTPQAAERLHEHTKGVPLHARALLQQVRAETLADVDAPLPAPRAYATLVRGRLGECEGSAQRLLTAAAVLGTSAPLHLVARMAELAEPLPALEQLTGAGLLVEWRTGAGVSVGFPNPLVRAAVYHDLGPATRRRLHLLAASLADDAVHRLHHRLAAADQVDDELVREVALVGRRQAAAGRWGSACGCLTRAVQLTEDGPARDRLIAETVEALLAAGRPGEAGALAAQVSPGGDPGVHGYVQGAVALVAGRVEEAVRLLGDAWTRVGGDAGGRAGGDGRARVGGDAGGRAGGDGRARVGGDGRARTGGDGRARVGGDAGGRMGGDAWLATAIAARQAMAGLLRGCGADAARWAECATATPCAGSEFERFARLVGLGLVGDVEAGLAETAELPVPAQATPGELDALLGRATLRLWADDLAGAQADLLGLVAVSAGRSAPFQLIAASTLAQAEYRLGRWDDAAGHAEIGASTADDFGQSWLASYAHSVAALVPAARGEWERAAGHVRAARAACSPGNVSAQVSTAVAEALVATARGDHDAVAAALTPLIRTDLPDEPAVALWRTLLADALVNAGRPEDAEEVLIPCELLALDRERRSVLAAAARARAGLHAARHEPGESEACYQVALEHTAKIETPFEEARIQLAYGTFLRRRGRRSAAAEQLEAAQLTLSRLGALPYLEQCDLELAASGRAVLRPQDTARLGLTPQEHTVAVLISRGLTNRQAARKLVLSVKTVEYHLSHIYTKLGITSRTALIGKLSDLGG
ncbi:AAA family ATPase [Nonomuraea sp. PA05]|uniref:helix-turn-helix transcriptional regulator n=1 Tax=Nonomuraea sp. PA05 TaxID=2604466 RepID=UPI0011D7FF07|nr:LuxR family transcriptional regulator [Nonomuraea sp. PA05]TYB52190.1 AAA family ATPase [Nonomuraea sp. PA05]